MTENTADVATPTYSYCCYIQSVAGVAKNTADLATPTSLCCIWWEVECCWEYGNFSNTKPFTLLYSIYCGCDWEYGYWSNTNPFKCWPPICLQILSKVLTITFTKVYIYMQYIFIYSYISIFIHIYQSCNYLFKKAFNWNALFAKCVHEYIHICT